MRKTLYLFLTFFGLSFCTNSARAQYSITSYADSISGSTCGEVLFHLYTSGCTSGLSVTAYYGDGTTSTTPVTCFSSIGSALLTHNYASTGVYTVKFVLYLGTSPIDTVSYNYDYHFCSNIQAYFYYDANSNCIKDAGDVPPHSPSVVKIDSSGVPIDTISGLSGVSYTPLGSPGTVYTLTLLTPPTGLMPSCPLSGVLTFTTVPTGSFVTPQYFGYSCATTSFDLSLYGTFIARATDALAYGVVTNSTCSSTSTTVKVDFSPKYTVSSLVPAYPYTISGNSITINLGSVSSYGYTYYNVIFNPVGTLTMGDTVNSTQTVFPIVGDANTTNNYLVRCDTIRASYDPNHKSVIPTGNISAGTTLIYTLEFENTGNDTAHNIHIMDTLSNFLDARSTTILSSSHPVNLIVKGGSNILKFDFPNIMLADSSHHDANKGMVAFSIKAKSTLAPGTVIPNRGGIYFDTNPVVMTNTVFSKIPAPVIGGVSLVNGKEVVLYPNPVKSTLSFVVDPGTYTSMTISNVLGQQVISQDFSANVNVSHLPSGIYYITLNGSSDITTMKFEKQ